jgi:putative ABC transport system substrate-binding protein
MKRRKFITRVGGAAAGWPLAVGAQQAGKLPTIGFMGAASPSIESQRVAAFVQRLRELAWIDGRNLAIEYRWAEGRDERYAEIATEFVRLKVDVIVTVATPATLAAKQATAVIPIVFVTASDPVGTGLVASLARPGGNVTGLANQISDAGGKKLEVLRARLPTMHGARDFVEAGGLMSYGPNLLRQFRRAADVVDKMLRGAKPNDIPVEQPTKFDLVINLTAAKALGLEIPPTLLARADEVIE